MLTSSPVAMGGVSRKVGNAMGPMIVATTQTKKVAVSVSNKYELQAWFTPIHSLVPHLVHDHAVHPDFIPLWFCSQYPRVMGEYGPRNQGCLTETLSQTSNRIDVDT